MNNNPFKTPMMANISGLKCDNPDCDYKDDTIDSVDYEQHIDKPCPDCGESLLTQDDYDKVMPTDYNEDPQYTELNPDMLKGLGDDENMNEAIKRFNKLI